MAMDCRNPPFLFWHELARLTALSALSRGAVLDRTLRMSIRLGLAGVAAAGRCEKVPFFFWQCYSPLAGHWLSSLASAFFTASPLGSPLWMRSISANGPSTLYSRKCYATTCVTSESLFC